MAAALFRFCQPFLQCQDLQCQDLRSRLDLGFIISLPLECGSSVHNMSVETVFSASAEVEIVEATCTKCGCLTADSRRSYVAVGAHVIIQLKRFRWDAVSRANAKVSGLLFDSRVVFFSPL